MSLSAKDRQALGSIQDQITGSDPQLASLMTMFTRLASGEKMPGLEDIRPGAPWPRAVVGRAAARTPRALSRRTRRLSRQPALYLLWLTVAITLITVTLTINRGGGTRSCTQSRAGLGACAGQMPVDSPHPGLPSAGRAPAIPRTTRPVAGLAVHLAGARSRLMRHLDSGATTSGSARPHEEPPMPGRGKPTR